jgi:hypothetical protein
MKPVTWMYVGAVILFLMSACGIGIGGFLYLGSLDPVQGRPEWGSMGAALACVGSLFVVGGILLIVLAVRKTRQETAQNVTLKVDLPGQTKIEQVKCQSCGGVLTADNIQLVNGAPMVNCPFCHTVYQMTEEPKW